VARRSGLGKGLDALIPGGSQAPAGTGGGNGVGLRDIAVDLIHPNPNQPRVHFDEAALAELSASIGAIGVLQPILVRPSGEKYELIAGERRWRAARSAGLTVIPAIVRVTDDVSSVEQALVENLHRQDLTPLEEAAAYQQLLEDFNMTHEQVATKVGKSRSAITNAIRLLSLPASMSASKGSVSTLREPGLHELEELLSEHLQTSVSVTMSGKHGKVVVDFADLTDLERIYRLMTEGPADND